MSPKNIIEEFFDPKMLSILKLFLFDEEGQFYLREISKKARVPVATTFRIIKKLKDMGVIEETVIKKTKLYSLSHNKNTKMLSELLEEKKTVIEEFIEYVSKLEGVEMIVRHGEESKDKTNIIVIGSNIDARVVKEKVGDIKKNYNFNIIELVLDPVQFNQMSSMGLFPGKKVILWEALR
ncbi:winged helix-turn-helix domain-containing protein [Candidatus Woesearchaeota archaeon]|nr:winged helix-turn-helix domain-containing protein [Candidatus Woesearchaeota archaeon]